MRVAITGSSGLIGRALVRSFEADGHTVHRVVRDRDRATGGNVYWSVQAGEIDPADLDGVDAVIHLAGKPIEPRRWSDAERAEFLQSRTRGTRLLAEALAACDDPPGVLVSQSGSGYYGSRGDEVLTEDSAPGTGFMADVCVQWEAAADPARDAGLRVVHPRTGVGRGRPADRHRPAAVPVGRGRARRVRSPVGALDQPRRRGAGDPLPRRA